MNKKGCIGILDSGVGGLTVAAEIEKFLPNEDITYIGDSINCPYGGKSKDEIKKLALKMISFLQNKNAKCILLACNTISVLADELRENFDIPIISIIEEASKDIIKKKPKSIGILATVATAQSRSYDKFISKELPECNIISQGSEKLAELIDSGKFESAEAEDEIKKNVDRIISRSNIDFLVLGCTHYPIALKTFKKCYPEIELFNPAVSQANNTLELLRSHDAENPSGGRFRLYSTGKTSNYLEIMQMLKMKAPDSAETILL